MTIKEFIKSSRLYDVISIESVISYSARRKINSVSKWLIIISTVIIFISLLFKKATVFERFIPAFIGIIVINVSLYLILKLLSFQFSSKYYFDKISGNKYSLEEKYTFSAGRILYAGKDNNILYGFLHSVFGKEVLYRLEISNENILTLKSKIKDIPESMPDFLLSNIVKVKDIINHIYENKDFSSLLSLNGISKDDILSACEWLILDLEKREFNSQWWRKDNLYKLNPIGREWSFGQTFTINRFCSNLLQNENVISESLPLYEREKEVIQIENILSKQSGANALLVGEPGQQKIEIIWVLARHIRNSTTAQELLNKKLMLLDTVTFISATKEKDIFETTLRKIFNESVKAGNIILAIDNIPRLISAGKQLNIDVVAILDPYLQSEAIQLVALSDFDEYRITIEPNKNLMSRFETVLAHPLEEKEITRILSVSALEIEYIYDVRFSFQSIKELSRSAEYYFSSGVTSDKARELLIEIAPWAKRKDLSIIKKEDVHKFIEQKTNIPLSTNLSAQDKDKLINLELLLGQKVVGQEEAIIALSNSLRRARSGIRNTNKPIGSFLFMGPTGVGKTETAKALAEIFFGSEDAMFRLDMSEYQTIDAIDKLIGSFTSNKPGILATALKEKPYGVILLDEFEKTDKNVLNLFLQILDEGFFSDNNGRKISARNTLFIATSNAGSEYIFDIISKGKDITSSKEEIIQEVISMGIFKPELINRFDGNILFKPLSKENLKKIALIQLKKLAKRMMTKGIIVDFKDEVVDIIVEKGSSKVFGARPMIRTIQDLVESKIASKILENSLGTGSKITVLVDKNEIIAEVI